VKALQTLGESAPSWVVLQLLEDCNLRCSMCYEWGETGAYHDGRKVASLALPVALRIIDECRPARPRFELFGGEPLLYEGIWEVIARIRESGCDLAFPTNGTLLAAAAERLVARPPSLVWVSLDGPGVINDAQRGNGVFKRAIAGLGAVVREKERRASALPALGVTCVVTPANHRHLEELFLKTLDLSVLGHVSIELQSHLSEAQHRAHVRRLRERFGVTSAPYARAYVRDPASFADIDRTELVRQMRVIRDACAARGVRFFSQPRTLEVDNVDAYLNGRWEDMADHRARCAVPWLCAEISARGDVTTCHTFYDVPAGNVNTDSLLAIWRGERLARWRDDLRSGLFPICTACCRYYQ
jgi:MoaA/NifB/PqqE/SkfB family radical SAM enzyme